MGSAAPRTVFGASMIARMWLGLVAVTFAFAGYVTVQVNRVPNFALTPAVQADLTRLLQDNALQVLPFADQWGLVRSKPSVFRLPHCAAFGYLMAVADTSLTDMHTARISEKTGTTYVNKIVRMNNNSGILEGRIARAINNFQSVWGRPPKRFSNTNLVLFLPRDCPHPNIDLQAFWSSDQTQV
jgi:hypothetical protein